MTTTDSKGPTASEIAIHVHRAADKLFECDLIDPPTLRYDYLHMGVVKLNEHDAMKQELEALKSWQKHYDRASPDTFAEIKKERDRYREALDKSKMIADHCIPVYAYGDNEAACDMSYKLKQIFTLLDEALNPQEHGGRDE